MSRWGFCLKVFSIVGCQLVLTAVMAALIMFNKPVQNLVLTNLPLQVGQCIRVPFITMYSRTSIRNDLRRKKLVPIMETFVYRQLRWAETWGKDCTGY